MFKVGALLFAAEESSPLNSPCPFTPLQLKKTKNLEMKEEIKQKLKQYKLHKKQEDQKAKDRSIASKWKKAQNAAVKDGQKPFYLKKSDEKELGLGLKFLELKKAGKLKSFTEKRRIKKAAKDKRWMPYERSDKQQ